MSSPPRRSPLALVAATKRRGCRAALLLSLPWCAAVGAFEPPPGEAPAPGEARAASDQDAPRGGSEEPQPAPKAGAAAGAKAGAAADVRPPRLIEPVDVVYPQGARGDATVVLELLVDERGRVAEATVIEGEPPFADVATRAVARFRFAPAQRGETPRAARIRFELRFTEPQPEPAVEPAPGAAAAPADAPPPPEPASVDVTVLGERKPVGSQSLSKAEVRQLPGAFGDPFRAIEALPGVTPLASGVPFFYVRGAPPGNVGYFLDGIRVPLLYHVGLGPSVIHPGMVKSVELYPGAYPARYGRYGGGIVAGLSEEPSTELRGEWQVRLFDAGALLEVPFAGGKGHVSVAGRYSYTAFLLSLFAEDVRLEYWDYQLRASYELTAEDTVSLMSFGSFDYFGEDTGSGRDEFLGTEFHRLDLRHEHVFDDGARLRSAAALGYDRTRGGEEATVGNPSLSLRSRFDRRLSSALAIELGLDVRFDDYGADFEEQQEDDSVPMPPSPDVPPELRDEIERARQADREAEQNPEDEFDEVFPTRTDFAAAVYVEANWQATPAISVTPGLRFDFFASDGATAFSIDPRVAVAFALARDWTLTHALGLAHQPPSFVIPVPGFQVGGLRGGLQRSVQHSAGVVRELPDAMRASLTLFHNQFFGLSDPLSLVRSRDVDDLELDERIVGRSYGVEVLARRDLSRKLGGFVSYTYSRSERFTPSQRIVAAFDRPHVLNLALSYSLSELWRAGGRFFHYSGAPADTPDTDDEILTGFVPAPGETGPDAELEVRSATLPERLPAFYRFDVRVEKRWPIGDSGAWWSLVLEVQNLTLNTEVIGYECSIDSTLGQPGSLDSSRLTLTRRCRQQDIGPVTIPSLGIEGRF